MAASSGEHVSVLIEADGGSRGNPGEAAYGAVLKDATTGEVVAERAGRSGSPPTTSRSTAA
jgi:ribonuclease HI